MVQTLIGRMYSHRPKTASLCWICSNAVCWGGAGCAGWQQLGASSAKVCFADGLPHAKSAMCPVLRRPAELSGRCDRCFLNQFSDCGFAFHIPHEGLSGVAKQTTLDEESRRCSALKDRQKNIIFLFIRSQALRERFFSDHSTDVSEVPSRFSSKVSLEDADVRAVFTWLWNPTPLWPTLLNFDVVLGFLYERVVSTQSKVTRGGGK